MEEGFKHAASNGASDVEEGCAEASNSANTLWDQMNAIEDGAERTKFFQEHKQEFYNKL